MVGLFDAVSVGGKRLKTRVVMAPMTRGRALLQGNVPSPSMVEYYRLRAAGGASLIVSEASFISAAAVGWYSAPGCWSEEQVERTLTPAHPVDGSFFCKATRMESDC
jgi:2,4-dienoyl-CoA reductase-like NADH-dependent reductase (Old Yellow Enzyme family)